MTDRSNLEAIEIAEAQWIAERFADNRGRFLDIGAGCGRGTLSKTAKLVDAGWSGVLVEASPAAFCRLAANYSKRGNLLLVNAGIRPTSGPAWFHDDLGNGLATFDDDHRATFETQCGTEFSRILVQSMSAADLLSAVGANFEFINVDAEGISVPIFGALAKAGALRICRLACIEKDAKDRRMVIEKIAETAGLVVLQETELDVIVGKK